VGRNVRLNFYHAEMSQPSLAKFNFKASPLTPAGASTLRKGHETDAHLTWGSSQSPRSDVTLCLTDRDSQRSFTNCKESGGHQHLVQWVPQVKRPGREPEH